IESLLYNNTNQTPSGLIDFLAVSHSTAPNYAIEWSSRTNYCPTITCGQQPAFATPGETLKALGGAEFDPRKTVYLPPESKQLVHVDSQSEGKIMKSQFSAHRVEIDLEANGPTLVVIAQSFYHHWRASIDGRPVPLLQANYAF